MKRLAVPFAIVAILLPRIVGAFSVSPAIIELSGDRGTSVKSQVLVKNTANAPQTYYLQTIKFAARENSGSPVFLSPKEDRSGLPEWIALSKTQVTVKAQSQLAVPFTVAVPADVPSGSYNGAVVISETPFNAGASGAAIQAHTAVLVLFTVNGETDAKAALLDFGPTASSSEKAAGAFRYRIQNQGNVFVTPKGTVTVTDLFGRELAQADANPDGGRVLPGMTRSYDGSFQSDLFAMGPVTAVLKLTYSEDAPTLFASYSFWVLPKVPIALAGIVLVGIVLAGLVLSRAKRSAS